MTDLYHFPRFFMGVSTSDGFIDGWKSPAGDPFLHLLSGVPGGGKSTLLKKAAAAALDRGETPVLYLCASDPSSADALAIGGALVLDNTPPHNFPAPLPGVLSHTYCLDDCLRGDRLPEKAALLPLWQAETTCRARAQKLFSAAREVANARFDAALAAFPIDRLKKRAEGVAGREFPRKKGGRPGVSVRRFLDAYTGDGPLFLSETAGLLCPRLYLLQDRYGMAPFFLFALLDAARARGLDTLACYDPLLPETGLKHLLIPSLGLGFLSTARAKDGPLSPARLLHLDDMGDQESLRRLRPMLRKLHKEETLLLAAACDAMKDASACHAELEALYRPALDFSAVDGVGEKLLSNLFAN